MLRISLHDIRGMQTKVQGKNLEFNMLATGWEENTCTQLYTTIRPELKHILNLKSASS